MKLSPAPFPLLAFGLLSLSAVCQVNHPGGNRTGQANGGDSLPGRSCLVKIFPYSQDPGVVTRPDWRNAPYDTTIFLRLVTGGRLNLYTWDDGAGVTYFFIGAGTTQPEQLRIRNTLVKKGVETEVLTDNLYQYQLADLVAGCPAVAARPVKVDYEENALNRLIATYNQCGAALAEAGKGKYGWTIHVLPMAGLLHSAVKMSGNTDAAYAGWPAFDGPTGGLGVLLQPSKGRRRLSIQVDGLYDHFSLNSHEFHKNYYQRYNARLDYDEIKGNLQIRYQIARGNIRPFLGIGISNTLIINNNSTQTLTDVGNAQNFRQSLEDPIRMYRPGAFVSAGAQFRHWVLEGRAEQTQGLTSLPGVSSPVTNFYLLIGYML